MPRHIVRHWANPLRIDLTACGAPALYARFTKEHALVTCQRCARLIQSLAKPRAEPEIFHLLTIQWQDWSRDTYLFRTHEAAKKKIEAIAAERYPDDGDLDLFSEHGHSWWIDEVTVQE